MIVKYYRKNLQIINIYWILTKIIFITVYVPVFPIEVYSSIANTHLYELNVFH